MTQTTPEEILKQIDWLKMRVANASNFGLIANNQAQALLNRLKEVVLDKTNA